MIISARERKYLYRFDRHFVIKVWRLPGMGIVLYVLTYDAMVS